MSTIGNITRLSFFVLATGMLFLQGCVKNTCDMTYTYRQYTPIYMDEATFENSVAVEAPRNLENPGKIFVKDDFLFVSEMGKGVHIFDNSDPAAPIALSFLVVPGNFDINANCDKLYVDSSTDLLVFDIKNPAAPSFVNRIKNTLPAMLSYRGFHADANMGVVVEWRTQVVTGDYDCETGIPQLWQINQADPSDAIDNGGNNTRSINPAVAGKGGSMSRFTVVDDYLYVVTPYELMVFNAASCAQPFKTQTVDINMWQGEAETIFGQGDLLFIGGTAGMYIYDRSNPEMPSYVSVFEHIVSCDPVVVDGDYAYVTLRNGQNDPCGDGFANELNVINISNPYSPHLARTFDMINPHGLGIDNDMLFLADGRDGLKIFDASKPEKVGNNQLAHFPNLQGYDVLPYNNTLIFVGEDGIAQYDYSNPKDIRLLSNIPVVR